MTAPEIVRPPWSDSQVANLNAFQAAGAMHPFTCGNEACPGVRGMHASLVAREDGWHCPACDYTQDWAHGFMAEWPAGGEAPERERQAEDDHAEFAGWMAAQGYDDSNSFDGDHMAEAFEAGMEAERDNGDWFETGDDQAAEITRLRELLDEIGVMAANAPDDEDAFGVCEQIAMMVAAIDVPDAAQDGEWPDPENPITGRTPGAADAPELVAAEMAELVGDMLQSFPDTADEQEWRDRAGALGVLDPDGKPYRAYTEEDL